MQAAQKIGFIGLGKMGFPIASRLLTSGFRLVVHDIRDEPVKALVEKGAERASTPADVAATTDIVLVSLPTPQVVEEVACGETGILARPRCRFYVDLSTTGPEIASRVGERLMARGIGVVDAPISGGVSGAEKGTLSIMTACTQRVYEELQPLLKTMGNPFYIGEKVGLGQMMKLVNNFLTGTALAATSEALTLGVKAGLDPKVMLTVINSSSGRNDATLNKFPRSVLDRSFSYGFAAGLMQKDVALFLTEAQRMGVPTHVGASVAQLWLHTVTQFGPTADFTNIIRCVEQWANVQVGASATDAQV